MDSLVHRFLVCFFLQGKTAVDVFTKTPFILSTKHNDQHVRVLCSFNNCNTSNSK